MLKVSVLHQLEQQLHEYQPQKYPLWRAIMQSVMVGISNNIIILISLVLRMQLFKMEDMKVTEKI